MCRVLIAFFILISSVASATAADSRLIDASRWGETDRVAQLLSSGIEVDTIDKNGNAAIYFAVRFGHLEILDMLIEAGADVNLAKRNAPSPTPVEEAIRYNQPLALQKLLKAGAEPVGLLLATQGDNAQIPTLLIQAGADPSELNDEGFSPLSYAAVAGLSDVVDLLIDMDVEIDQVSFINKLTPLMLASRNGKVESAKQLLEAGAQIDLADKNGWTALMFASSEGHLEIARMLVVSGADVLITDDKERSAVILALSSGREEIVKMLVESGAPMVTYESTASPVNKALISAAQGEQTKYFSELLEAGADIDTRDSSGRSPLIISILERNREGATLLIELGANVTIRDSNRATALHYASAGNSGLSSLGTFFWTRPLTEIVDLLLENGADVNAKDKFGNTPLHYASASGHREVMARLLAVGAKLNDRNSEGLTPLLLSMMEEPAAADFLIERGASTTGRDMPRFAFTVITVLSCLLLTLSTVRLAKNLAPLPWQQKAPSFSNIIVVLFLIVTFSFSLHFASRAEVWFSTNSWELTVKWEFIPGGAGIFRRPEPGYPVVQIFANRSECERAKRATDLPAPPANLAGTVVSKGLTCHRAYHPSVWSRTFAPSAALTGLLAAILFMGPSWVGFAVLSSTLFFVVGGVLAEVILWEPYLFKSKIISEAGFPLFSLAGKIALTASILFMFGLLMRRRTGRLRDA